MVIQVSGNASLLGVWPLLKTIGYPYYPHLQQFFRWPPRCPEVVAIGFDGIYSRQSPRICNLESQPAEWAGKRWANRRTQTGRTTIGGISPEIPDYARLIAACSIGLGSSRHSRQTSWVCGWDSSWGFYSLKGRIHLSWLCSIWWDQREVVAWGQWTWQSASIPLLSPASNRRN